MSRLTSSLGRYAALPLRLGAGMAMVLHGWPKVTEAGEFVAEVEQMGIPYGGILGYVAIASEFLGGICLVLGFYTRIAALFVAATMGVAVVQVHGPKGYFASDGGFEYPLLILLCALSLAMGGPGRASVDAMRGRA